MRTAIRTWQRLAPVALALCLVTQWVRAAEPPAKPAAAPAAVGAPAPATAAAPEATPEAGAFAAAPAGDATGEGGTRALDEQIQDLKQQVVDLNKDLFVLEEELLFPANTQVAVFVSMDVGSFFGLDSVTLRAALVKGGVQRLYVGNLKAGSHELVALFSGKGPNDRDYRRGASIKFEKGVGAKYLELKISDKTRRQQPEFEIKDWE